MRWAIRVARVAGIDIEVHLTFLLALGLGAMHWGARHGGRGALFGAALTALLFVCVALHELGHSLVAQRFGLRVQRIVLWPLGGVAMMSGRVRRPLHELLIAAAGPAVNVVIAAALFAIASAPGLAATAAHLSTPDLPLNAATAVLWLLTANLGLSLFNLIPAFPLDGGRILRALLAMALGQASATRIAATVGQILAVGLGVLAFFTGHFMLGLIAVFVFLGAGQERAAEESAGILASAPAGLACRRHAVTLSPDVRVSAVVHVALGSAQSDFAVLHGDRLLGVVTRDELTHALATLPGDPYVVGIMEREVVRVGAGDSLEAVLRVMEERGARVVAVEDEAGLVVGLLSREDIAAAVPFLHLIQARRAAPAPVAGEAM